MSVSTYGPRCPKPDPMENGICRNCGRPTAMVGRMLQHKRGRWRDPLGLAKPRGVGQAIRIRSSVRVIPTKVPTCPDCDAYTQLVAGVWRCPWSTAKRHTTELVTTEANRMARLTRCNWPFKNPDNRRVA